MATLEQQRAWLDDLFKHGDRTSDFQAARVEALIRSLQFHGARVAEPRGLSDTGLDDHHLRRALEFGVSDRLAEEILAHLDRYGRFLDAAEKLYEAERAATQNADGTACCVDCPGWAIFDVNREPGREVERCDECDRFCDDDEATDHVLRKLGLSRENAGIE